jgi:hypothetical protein
MLLREEEPVNDYKAVIYAGCAIESKRVCICDLRNEVTSYRHKGNGMYQVHSDKYEYSKVFLNIDDAVKKFIELKRMA